VVSSVRTASSIGLRGLLFSCRGRRFAGIGAALPDVCLTGDQADMAWAQLFVIQYA